MAEQPQAEESVVSQPTYKTEETAQAFSNLLNQTAKTEEPQIQSQIEDFRRLRPAKMGPIQ